MKLFADLELKRRKNEQKISDEAKKKREQELEVHKSLKTFRLTMKSIGKTLLSHLKISLLSNKKNEKWRKNLPKISKNLDRSVKF